MAISAFIEFCANHNIAQPLDKIIKNLCTFLCQDVEQTPTFAYTRQCTDGILSLHAVNSLSQQSSKDSGKLKDKPGVEKPDESAKARLSRRGARLAFDQLALKFGPRLLDIIPSMWQSMAGGLVSAFQSGLFRSCLPEMCQLTVLNRLTRTVGRAH